MKISTSGLANQGQCNTRTQEKSEYRNTNTSDFLSNEENLGPTNSIVVLGLGQCGSYFTKH
jgi:hypothetical protein